jgi:GNAT superfamily N-acetyltransferase
MTQALAWKIEEVCFNAFPSLKQVLYGNWLMRFADGLTRRANSVNALRPECAGDDPMAVIAAAEALYREQGLPTIFRVLSILDPALDRALTARGYSGEGPSCLLYGAIGAIAAADPAVRLSPRPEPEWLAAMARLQGHSPAQAATYRRIVAAIAVPARFALLAVDGVPAALAYGALHDGLLCYESVVTDPRYRRQGLGRRVIAGLAHWAREDVAAGACLEVETGNAPALALYARFGLAEAYRYHYRREPLRM